MTAGSAAVADGGSAVSVAAVRSFIGQRRRRSWLDWYFGGFVLVVAALYLSDLLASPLSRLSAAGHTATQAAATQAVAGTGLVIGAAAGLLMLTQALGPLALSPADASWLLLSPLDRRAVLRRAATTAAVVAVVAGGLLGVLALAMAGPYLAPESHTLPSSWLALAAVAGAGLFLAAVAAEVLAQPAEGHRRLARGCCALVAVVALAEAVLGERLTVVSHAITSGFGGLSTAAFGTIAVVALALAAVAVALTWWLLPQFPAGVLRTDSARAGRALTAAAFLNLPLLAWIAEDDHWRGRLLPSRPWPKLPPAMALAWADWRRLGRRPGSLAVLAVSTVVPALGGAAITGHARGYVIAAALLAGALAAGTQGTTGSKRDLNDPALRRMLGVDAGPALTARAVLPALLATAWLTVALTLLAALGVLAGWLWPLLGLAAGPALAAAALRMARTAPINPAEPGIDTPMGTYYPWMITRLVSLLFALISVYPALRAVRAGHVQGSTFTSQLIWSAVVLGGYLMIAGHGNLPFARGPRYRDCRTNCGGVRGAVRRGHRLDGPDRRRDLRKVHPAHGCARVRLNEVFRRETARLARSRGLEVPNLRAAAHPADHLVAGNTMLVGELLKLLDVDLIRQFPQHLVSLLRVPKPTQKASEPLPAIWHQYHPRSKEPSQPLISPTS